MQDPCALPILPAAVAVQADPTTHPSVDQHQYLLEGLGLDPERYSGFAAGLGVERFCMVRHGIDDIRRLYTSDLRFLEQF